MSVCWLWLWCGSPLLCFPKPPPNDGPQVFCIQSLNSLLFEAEDKQPLLGMSPISRASISHSSGRTELFFGSNTLFANAQCQNLCPLPEVYPGQHIIVMNWIQGSFGKLLCRRCCFACNK